MPAGSQQPTTSPSPVSNGAADSKASMPLVYQRISMPYQKNLKRETIVDIYSKWDNYDDLLNPQDYRGPSQAADHVTRYIPDRESRILDLAAGTGLVGKELLRHGYSRLDAVEPSHNLEKSGSRSLYQEHYSCFFGPTDASSELIDTGAYDCVVSCGAYGENHLPVPSIDESLRVLKKGGICIICMREAYLEEVEAYRGIFVPHVYDLEKRGLCKVLAHDKTQNYFVEKTGVVFVLEKC